MTGDRLPQRRGVAPADHLCDGVATQPEPVNPTGPMSRANRSRI
jgi:hypothetical protein